MIIWETAAKMAALPSIKAETFAILLLPPCYPMSIVIAVPIILYGPPSISPISSRAT